MRDRRKGNEMSEVNLNQIYSKLGELSAVVVGLTEKIDSNERRNVDAIHEANQSRSVLRHQMDNLLIRTTHLETNMATVSTKVIAMEEVTAEVTSLRLKAQGAGTLGYWLLRLGGFVLGAAGGFAAAYTWLTGRPPP